MSACSSFVSVGVNALTGTLGVHRPALAPAGTREISGPASTCPELIPVSVSTGAFGVGRLSSRRPAPGRSPGQ